MTAAPRLLIVSGSAHSEGPVATVVSHIEQVATDAGAALRCHRLAHIGLPMMDQGDSGQDRNPVVQRVRADVSWAQGFVLVTPEYHGNMSGALKNWFDFLWHELAGKFAGVVSVTGGGGGDMSLTAVRNCFNWCHGFTLPYHAAVRPTDLTADGQLSEASVRDRIARITHDVCRYAPIVGTAFEEARGQGPGLAAGVAGLHHADERL